VLHRKKEEEPNQPACETILERIKLIFILFNGATEKIKINKFVDS
jgi:hypothetical protein